MNSAQILSDTGLELNVTGNKFKADGYYGFTDGLHTVGFYLNEFIGKLTIQGTLVSEPTDEDWFDIVFDDNTDSVQYDDLEATTGLIIKNFVGNFIWIRAKLDRSYIEPEPSPSVVGRVLKIIMNH